MAMVARKTGSCARKPLDCLPFPWPAPATARPIATHVTLFRPAGDSFVRRFAVCGIGDDPSRPGPLWGKPWDCRTAPAGALRRTAALGKART
jgi:hypothetical protein